MRLKTNSMWAFLSMGAVAFVASGVTAAAGCGSSDNGVSLPGGTAAGGAAGQGGGTGFGASGGGVNGSTLLGTVCDDDTQCGPNGKCLKPDGKELGNGGPAHGYCTTSTPCSMDSDCGAQGGGFCVPFTKGGPGYCMRACIFANPSYAGAQVNQVDLSAAGRIPQKDKQFDVGDKCAARTDIACTPIPDSTNAQNALTDSHNNLVGYCTPSCGNDSQCPVGRRCDSQSGLCVDQAALAPTLGKLGAPCDYEKEVKGMARQCEGLCFALYDQMNPSVSAEQKKRGICLSSCEVGTNQSCGGMDTGLCVATPVIPLHKPGTPAGQGKDQDLVRPSAGDVGLCFNITAMNDDSQCLWRDGFFALSIPNSATVCTAADTCTTKNDCAFSCATKDDCAAQTDSCVPVMVMGKSVNKCKAADGSFDTSQFDCYPVAANGKSYCLDHAPKLNGAGGSGGASGAAGAAGMSGGAGIGGSGGASGAANTGGSSGAAAAGNTGGSSGAAGAGNAGGSSGAAAAGSGGSGGG